MSTKLLITGGTGTLGSHLVRQAVASNHWDAVHSTYYTLNPNYHKVFWHYLDARNLIRSLLEKIQPDTIIHTLAMSSPDECEKKKLDSWQINVETVKEIIQYCHHYSARLVFTSTDLVFDGNKGNYKEEDVPNPINFYGDTKYEAEKEILETGSQSRNLVVRLSLLYGPNLNLRPNYFHQMVKALFLQQPLELFEDQYRTVLSVSNAAECLLELVKSDVSGLLHLGGPERINRYEFGLRLAENLKLSANHLKPVKMDSSRLTARRPADVSLVSHRAASVLNTPILNVEEGIQQIINNPLFNEVFPDLSGL